MEAKREDCDLPTELLILISSYMTKAEVNRWAMTCDRFYTLFRPERKDPNFLLSPFQTCVVRGEQEDAEKILKIDLSLMVKEAKIIDNSNREFYTSAFKYILGALDTRYMFNMFLNCLREEKYLPLQKKKEIALELLKQYQEFEKEGITYTLDGITYKNEQHFGFIPLLEALKTYVNNFKQWTWEDREKCFCTQVGKAQILVPAHLAQHYCDPDVPFDPKPTFTAERFKRCLNVTNYVSHSVHKWWEQLGDFILGEEFGYIRCAGAGCGVGGRWLSCGVGRADLEAITALFEIRMRDKIAIMPALKALIQEFEQALESQEQTSLGLK